MGHCISVTGTAAREPEPVVLLSRLSYTDKLLLNGKKIDTVPSLIIGGSSIYKRRNMEALNDCEEENRPSVGVKA